MSELTTFANPPEFYGQPVRMAIDQQNMTWWSLDDLVMAATDDLANKTTFRDNQAQRVVELLPNPWCKDRAGLPLLVNEPAAYFIAFRFNYLDMADWLARVIVANRSHQPNV